MNSTRRSIRIYPRIDTEARETIINPAEYCFATEEMCRAPTKVKCTDGESRTCVCTKLKEECNRHVQQVGKHPTGWYKTITPQQRLDYPLGEADKFVADATMQEIKQLARDAAARAPEEDTDDETVDVTPRASNSNRSTSHHRNPRGSPNGSISNRTRSGRTRSEHQGSLRSLPNYQAESPSRSKSTSKSKGRDSRRSPSRSKPSASRRGAGRSKSRDTGRSKSQTKSTSAANIRETLAAATTAPRSTTRPSAQVVGILFPDGTRYTTSEDAKVGAALRKGGTYVENFPSFKEAKEWADDVDASDSEESYTRRPSSHSRRSYRHSARGSSHQRAPRQPVFSVSTGSDERNSTRSRQPEGRKPTTRIDVHQTDPSAGDKDKIFGTQIDGRNMDKLVGPPDLDSLGTQELYDMAPDIASLPGKISIIAGEYSNGGEQTQASIVDALQQAFIKGTIERVVHRDQNFGRPSRHAFSSIKDEDSLRLFLNGLDECREAVFNRFNRGVTQLMLLRLYSDAEITAYKDSGGLPQLLRKTFDLYKSLVETINTECRKAENYDKSVAAALTSHHSKELNKIRTYALTKKDVVLRTYAYLRDSKKTDFHSHKVQQYLWARLEEYQALATSCHWEGPYGARAQQASTPSAAKATRCSHCTNARLHTLVRPAIKIGRAYCPFRAVPAATARKIRAAILIAFDKDPTITSISQTMLQEFIQKEADGELVAPS